MLVSLKEILEMKNDGEAVGSFNSPSLACIKAVVAAAESVNRPVILGHAEVHEKYAPLELIGGAMVAAAKKATVPVCVLLDHGQTMEYCFRAAEVGFTGIMYDGSRAPYEENLANTKNVVTELHKKGVSVEAELGTLNRHETEEEAAAEQEPDIYTDPDVAVDFVRQTGVDALAVAFGTAHGIYLKEPKLDLERLEKLNECISIPLVMHGGSGISEENYRKVISLGVEKINYFTYMSAAGGRAAGELLQKNPSAFLQDIELAAEKAMYENALGAIKIFSGIK